MKRIVLVAGLAILTALPAAGSETRTPCADRDPLRRPFFGDLHVHTTLSLDAATQGTRLRPRDAYRFARGAEVGLAPHDEDGNPLRRLRLNRPLDFAAVTDHAELFGELHICRTPGLAGYDSAMCAIYRRWPRLAFLMMNSRTAEGPGATRFSFCGPEGEGCLAASRPAWDETIAAAEEAYDRSEDCNFTSFVGYEWTGAPMSQNLHRNVIFRDHRVPDLPVSVFEAGLVSDLWRLLDQRCRRDTPGCEVLAIPHNSNLSGGLLFAGEEENGRPFTPAYAELRRRSEPLVELIQHKGDSECRTGVGTGDEFCNFEPLPYDTFSGKFTGQMAAQPAPSNFVRNALGEGLVWEGRLGTNPFEYGFVGSTDTHLGTPGYVDERAHPGHGGAGTPATAGGAMRLPDDIEFNPGGLAVVWAEENSRESIFAALQRRETYSTSGPRMTVRFFGGWDLEQGICSSADLAALGYQQGVPMGGRLGPAPDPTQTPRMLVSALADPGIEGRPGIPLDRVQIVKGWTERGEAREEVFDIAGAGDAPWSVDPATCSTGGSGPRSLCAVWSDPDFDPSQRAFYYARVLERPTCRWHAWFCNDAGVRCDQSDAVEPTLAACCDPTYPRTIQERAVTSPIWYSPPA